MIYSKIKENKMLKKVSIILIIIFMVSCSKNGVSKNDVLSFMDTYFEEIKQNDFNKIESYYSETFYKNSSREAWEELFNKVHSIIGKLESTELESWNMKSMLATSGSGTTYTLIYKNKYENGIVTETINIFVPKGKNEIGIIGHNYNSNLFVGL
jgi:hypothetical protein